MSSRLKALADKNRSKIEKTMKETNGKYVSNIEQSNIAKKNQELREKEEYEKRQKLIEFKKAQELIAVEDDPDIDEKVNKQLTDSWSLVVTRFQRQIEESKDLRIDLAGPEVYEEQVDDDHRVKFLKGIFKEWRYRLNNLPDEELVKKKDELCNLWYCLFALQPLFNALNNRTLSADLTINIDRIVDALKKPDFNKAYAAYNDMAIGNAIWPIGVTQYSIHWKFSMDLMDSKNVLHIFNSEAGRNAILSIRRFMNVYRQIHQKDDALKPLSSI